MKLSTEIAVGVGLPIILLGGLVAWCSIRAAAPIKTAVEIIDGCEYLRYPAYYHSAITHKGNCKNH